MQTDKKEPTVQVDELFGVYRYIPHVEADCFECLGEPGRQISVAQDF